MNPNRPLTLTVLLLLTLLSGCGLTPKTESAVKTQIAVNAGHEKDAGLPASAHAIAQDNRDILWSILFNEGAVDDVPADVRARWEARKKAKAVAGGDK